MSAFLEAIERELKDVHFFSVGAIPGCDECGLADLDKDEADSNNGQHRIQCAEEGGFYRTSCDSCGNTCAGQRFPAHGVIAESEDEARKPEATITHFDVCSDCLVFHANGEEPQNWRKNP
jgi:hypothetical protein